MQRTGIRLDPWPAEYESSFQIDEFDPESAGKVETEVEGIGWQAVEPQPRARPEPIHFVDGVRRVEARIILDDESGELFERGVATTESIEAGSISENQSSLIVKAELCLEPTDRAVVLFFYAQIFNMEVLS